jgi:hypothetical protein
MKIARLTGDEHWKSTDTTTGCFEALASEAEWLTLLAVLVGDAVSAATAYANVLSAMETDDDLSVIWGEHGVAV